MVAWVRLDTAIQGFNQTLRKEFGITGLQLAVLRILGERPSLPLAALRKSLVMHPATLGQSIDELRTMGLCTVERDGPDGGHIDYTATLVEGPEAARALATYVPQTGYAHPELPFTLDATAEEILPHTTTTAVFRLDRA